MVAGRRLGGSSSLALAGREAGNRTACPDSSRAAQLGRSHAAQLAGQVGGTLSLTEGAGRGGAGTPGPTFLELSELSDIHGSEGWISREGVVQISAG